MAHGELRKRGDYWFCRVVFSEDGKRRVKEWRVGTNKAEARMVLKNEVNRLNGHYIV